MPLRRRLILALAGAAAALLALWLLRTPLLASVARFLSVGEPPRPADLLYVLGGDLDSRPFLAAELYRRGIAPRIALPREERGRAVQLGLYPDHTEVVRQILRREGVPDSAIVVLEQPGGSTSTAEDARLLREYVVSHRIRRVTVITHRWHTRRARWLLRRELAGTGVEVAMAGAPDPRFREDDWWRSEAGLVTYATEYLKLVHNRLYR